MQCSVADIADSFPETRIAFVMAADLAITTERPKTLDRAIVETEAAMRRRFGGCELARIPAIQDWRLVYKRFGIKKTSYRSSVERLLKNVLAGRGLPRVNNLVDCYNLVSLAHLVPVGADDLAKLTGPIAFRPARAGDSFVPMGSDPPRQDPPKVDEIVYADGAQVLCRRWNWYQDQRTAVCRQTETALLTVQAQGTADLEAATADLCVQLARYCAARTGFAIASAAAPVVTCGLAS